MIGILPKYVEIRTIEPRALVQSIELSKPRLVSHGKYIYVASSSHVWRLVPVPIPMQILQLLDEKQFELALLLAVSTSYYRSLIKPDLKELDISYEISSNRNDL